MNIWASDGTPQYIYVGSLMQNKTSSLNREKIKVEIFGGDYGSKYVGSATYRIGTRYHYVMNKEVHGGGSSRYKLRVFENGDKLDIVVETISWAALVIRSWILDYKSIAHEVQCTKYYDITGKNDITDQFISTFFLASDLNGNIGIGTLAPKSKLDVRGKIIADEVEVKVNRGADFVFLPDYSLKPLSEVETFVQEYKHLPDIPSEKEMQEKGLNLNDMQMKLLQKIEELTLYVIEQDKKYSELKKENEILSNRTAELEKKQKR